MKHLLRLSLLVMLAATFTSCSNDDPYYSPLVGSWQLYDASAWVSNSDSYTFYDNGTGYYNGIDQYGRPQYFPINWNSYNGNTLYVYFQTYPYDTWSFYYDFNGGYLHLVSIDTSVEYWYRRVY